VSRAEESYAAEVVALAALTFHDAVQLQGHIARYGEPQWDPNHTDGPSRRLEVLLAEWKAMRDAKARR